MCNILQSSSNIAENIECSRFLAKYDTNKTTDPPPVLDSNLVSALESKIFEYVGTRINEGGAVYQSTKSDGDAVVVYNFDNVDKPKIGWRGNVIFKILLPSLLLQSLLNQKI